MAKTKVEWRKLDEAGVNHIGSINGVDTFTLHKQTGGYNVHRIANVAEGDGNWLGLRKGLHRAKSRCVVSAMMKGGI